MLFQPHLSLLILIGSSEGYSRGRSTLNNDCGACSCGGIFVACTGTKYYLVLRDTSLGRSSSNMIPYPESNIPCTKFHISYLLCRYRAKYITGSVLQLLAKPEGGDAWLQGLRSASYEEALSALTTLPGVRWLTCLLYWWGVEYKLREETLGCIRFAHILQESSALTGAPRFTRRMCTTCTQYSPSASLPPL